MKAKYHFFKTPKRESESETPELHVRLTHRGTVSFKELCNQIADQSTVTQGDVEGAVSGIIHNMIKAMKMGYTVEIEDLGYFKAIAKAPPVKDPEKFRAEHVSFSRVSFKAAKSLVRKMQSMNFVRDPERSVPDPFPEEKRIARILRYLEKEGVIYSSDCMQINRCSRYLAQKDLRIMRETKQIRLAGGRKSGCYVLNTKTEEK